MGAAGASSGEPNLHPSFSSVYLIRTVVLEQTQYQGEAVDVHEVASLVVFWLKRSLINTLIRGGRL